MILNYWYILAGKIPPDPSFESNTAQTKNQSTMKMTKFSEYVYLKEMIAYYLFDVPAVFLKKIKHVIPSYVQLYAVF